MKHKGGLTKWNDEWGFGFISPSDGGDPVFVHLSAFGRGQARPVLNRSLTYRLVRDEKQRPRTAEARYSDRRPVRKRNRGKGLVPVVLVVMAFFFGLMVCLPVPEWERVAGVYALVSLVTFALYGLDKRAAKRGAWRTAEARLHVLAVCGGWPGALLAQRVFRHKTRKVSFRAVFYVAVMANLAMLVWLLYADSGRALRFALGVRWGGGLP